MKLIILNGILESFRSMKDGGVKIIFETQELTPDMYATISTCLRKYCEILIKEGEVYKEDIETFQNHQFDEFDKRQDKTPSQRMRNVLYILWEQDKEGYDVFKDYYDFKLEKFIEHLKLKII